MVRAMAELPPCGLYRTRSALGEVPPGRLVYFHNHGDPGPGVYLPSGWRQNKATFHARGITLPAPEAADALEPLPAEGFYRVEASFECCDKKCRTFERGSLVQLGYDGNAQAILFAPEWTQDGFVLPERGAIVTPDRLSRLEPLKVSGTAAGQGDLVH